MNNIQWLYPNTIDKALQNTSGESFRFHAGGTTILRSGPGRIKTLVDLSALGLDYISDVDGVITIGATSTYGDIVRYFEKNDRSSILYKCLVNSATTALRNRITLGGSVAAFPIWSDIMGALIALDAKVVLNDTETDVVDYSRNRQQYVNKLITSIKFDKVSFNAEYHRQTRTEHDYSAFNIVFLWNETAGKYSNSRIVVVGNTEKFARLTAIERFIAGKSPDEIDIDSVWSSFAPKFPAKKLGSADYVGHLAKTALKRMIKQSVNG
jgi:CO/xanthine dehydrogenase FAD-binding subunit